MIKALIERLLGTSSWDTAERRGGLRVRAQFDLELASPPLARYVGNVLDISPAGLKMRIRGPWNGRVLKRGKVVRLRHLNPPFDAELDSVQAKIGWVRKESVGQFLVALSYEESPDDLRRSWVRAVLQKSVDRPTKQKREQLRVRFNVVTTATVGEQTFEGHLRDISSRGARLESFRGLAPGTNLTLRIPPVKPFREMHLKAVVRRSELRLGTYHMGLAFILDEQQKRETIKLVKHILAIKKRTSL